MRKIIPPTLFLFVKIVLAILVPLHFHGNFRITLSISTKKSWWDIDSLLALGRFFVEFLGFHAISDGDNFMSSFSICMCFISFACLTVLARTSNTMLNNSGESRYPCLVSDLRRKVSSVSPLWCQLWVFNNSSLLSWGSSSLFLLL